MITEKDQHLEMNGSSSDEIALLRFCEQVGFLPQTNTSNDKVIEVKQGSLRFGTACCIW